MENVDLSGIPLQLIAGFVCFLLAALFVFLWPKNKAKPYKRISWPGYILHYFHPFAWALLGMAALLSIREPGLGVGMAVLGGIVYAIFIVMLVKA
jgi:hypothetical protein